MKLLKALEEFLSSGEELDYDPDFCECGKVKLHTLESIKDGVIWFDTSTAEGKSYIEIPAISIIKECEGYDPDYILCWLPNEKVYASWDCDHWIILVFPEVKWADIVEDPIIYLNAQWGEFGEYAKEYNPRRKYQSIVGWPF